MPYQIQEYSAAYDGDIYCCDEMKAIGVTQSISGTVPYALYVTTLYQCTRCRNSRTVTRGFLADPVEPRRLNQR